MTCLEFWSKAEFIREKATGGVLTAKQPHRPGQHRLKATSESLLEEIETLRKQVRRIERQLNRQARRTPAMYWPDYPGCRRCTAKTGKHVSVPSTVTSTEVWLAH